MKIFEPDLVTELRGIHSALDDALGDSDIEFLEDDELRDSRPTQWAAMRLARVISTLEQPAQSEPTGARNGAAGD